MVERRAHAAIRDDHEVVDELHVGQGVGGCVALGGGREGRECRGRSRLKAPGSRVERENRERRAVLQAEDKGRTCASRISRDAPSPAPFTGPTILTNDRMPRPAPDLTLHPHMIHHLQAVPADPDAPDDAATEVGHV